MAVLRELEIALLDLEARILLESLTNEIARLKHVAETSDDEDAASDAGNDCLDPVGLKERIEKEAVSVFGKQLTES